jgi:hypothetical protein
VTSLALLVVPAFTSSLNSVTENYNWDFAYTKEFLVAVDELDIDKMKAIPKEAIDVYGGHNLGWQIF